MSARTPFPNESPEYTEARKRLLQQEIELRRMAESVAAARRALPPGGVLKEDYVFEGTDATGAPTKTRLSELFGRHDTLALYSYMFGPERDRPCPMCTGLLDALNGVHRHVSQRLSVVAVGEAPLARLQAFREERGWRSLPLLSANGSRYNVDYHGKMKDGSDSSMLNLFRREGSTIRHFWASELSEGPSDPGQDSRGLDMINPIFTLMDFTPEGRGRFYTKVDY